MIDLQGKRGTIILGLIVGVSFAFGLLIGHLITPSGTEEVKETSKSAAPSSSDQLLETTTTQHTGMTDRNESTESSQNEKYEIVLEDKWHKEKDMINDMINRFDKNNIKETLRYLSEKPHMAATPRDNELAEYIKKKFEKAGLDSVELVPYNLYLSKPDPNNPNKITLHMNGEKLFESNHKEVPIHPGDEDPEFVDAFNAFTPAGTVTTEPGVGVVYVNYGRREDFDKLKELGINITGHIALARYGKIYRGNKVRHAEQFGAKGIIIFSDPEDVAADGITPEDVYDHTWWLPGTGMQRGSTYLGDGDPLTPGWPSLEHAYRIAEDEADLHKIPCQPIGYSDAMQILMRLDGEAAPEEWQGGFPDFTYRLGPSFNNQNLSVTLTLSTHNSGKIEKSFNVIGIIKGSIEPDRYVLIGNHRDAWGYGAADPSSGTTQFLETVRVYGTFLEEGWRPRRTIIFCSWGAEEFGLIGSTEWVEENIDKLQSRAIAYINTDTCTSGPELHIRASPLMHDLFINITQLIPGVKNSSRTLFDEWKEYNERYKPDAPEHPIIKALGSGSDYAAFSIYGGVPAADIWFRRDEVKYNISMYPFYHTGYETFYMVSNFVDPEFKINEGCGRLASLTIKYLADSSIIPYSIGRFPSIMLSNLKKSKNRDKLIQIYDKYIELENSLQKFEDMANQFEGNIKSMPSLSELQLRTINDQMMKLEQIFILPEGLPGRPTVRNAAFSPSQFDNYSSDGFPGLTDLLFNFDSLSDSEKDSKSKMIRRHISDLTIMAERGASFLQEVFLV